MKIKKSYVIIGIILLLIAGWILVRFIIGGNEDSWIKDNRGVWIKHGNPSEIPDYVIWQKNAIACAYDKFRNMTEEPNSQCLGICEDYAVDIVHVPRSSEDNLPENQCEDYRSGKVSHFIELDKDGNVVRVV